MRKAKNCRKACSEVK